MKGFTPKPETAVSPSSASRLELVWFLGASWQRKEMQTCPSSPCLSGQRAPSRFTHTQVKDSQGIYFGEELSRLKSPKHLDMDRTHSKTANILRVIGRGPSVGW